MLRRRKARGARGRNGLAVLLGAVLATSAAAEENALGRWRPGGYVETYVVGRTESRSPKQRPTGIVDLNLTGDLGRSLRLYADMTSSFGGTPVGAGGGGVVDPRLAFQNLTPAVEFQEAWADVFLPRVDLRLGLQKFAWGKLDTFNPTDVLNPRRYTDPFVLRESDLKIGVPALRASYFPESFSWIESPSATAIWIPMPISFRFPLQRERWYPPAANVPEDIDIPPGSLGAGLPGTTVNTTLETRNQRAPWRFENGAGALRFAATTLGADWSLVYYDGPETAPAFDFDISVLSPGAQAKLAMGQSPTLEDLTQLDGAAVLQPRLARIHLVGGDLAVAFGGLTARAEFAYGAGRLVPRSTAELLGIDSLVAAVGPQVPQLIAGLLRGESVPVDLGPLFVRRDVFEWGVGADYPWRGWVPVLQVNQSVVLDNDITLLVPDVDTRLLAALRRSFVDDRLAAELVGVQGLERSYTTVQLRATYSFTDEFWVRVGYLAIAGTRNSVIGQYRDNDQVFVQARYSF